MLKSVPPSRGANPNTHIKKNNKTFFKTKTTQQTKNNLFVFSAPFFAFDRLFFLPVQQRKQGAKQYQINKPSNNFQRWTHRFPCPMKSAARCDTQSELQNFVSLQILERTLRLWFCHKHTCFSVSFLTHTPCHSPPGGSLCGHLCRRRPTLRGAAPEVGLSRTAHTQTRRASPETHAKKHLPEQHLPLFLHQTLFICSGIRVRAPPDQTRKKRKRTLTEARAEREKNTRREGTLTIQAQNKTGN